MSVERSYKAELAWRIRDALEIELMDEIDEDDPARVSVVVVGKYTDELRGIVLSVHLDHPLGFSSGKHDAVAEGTPRTYHDRPWDLPSESIGGSMWDRAYSTVQLRSLLSKSPQDAAEIIDMAITRIAVVINSYEGLTPFVDPYGYTVFALRTAQRFGYASGGGNTAVDSHWCDYIARVSYKRHRE